MQKDSQVDINGLLQLCSIPNIGPLRIRALMARFKAPKAILSASVRRLVEVPGIDIKIAQNIKTATTSEFAQTQLKLVQKAGAQIITLWHKHYPPLLREIPDTPVLLFVNGEITEQDHKAISIVGTRNPSSYGKILAERFSEELGRKGVTVVSGMARGIDTFAHSGALKGGGRTIAVLGSGIDVIYPAENASLAKKIAQNGAVISELPMGTEPDAPHFPRRNRIISGMSAATVIVEAGLKSGALITASCAVDTGREVFALPGNVNSPKSYGTNRLIQQGAKLVMSIEDIFEGLGPSYSISDQQIGFRKPAETFNSLELRVLESLSNEPLHIDKVSEINEITISKALAVLLTLELGGYVKQLAGKMFVRI